MNENERCGYVFDCMNVVTMNENEGCEYVFDCMNVVTLLGF